MPSTSSQPDAPTATLLSVNVGMPQPVQWQGRSVYTGIWKQAVPGPRMARRLNLDGDGQGDRNGHGGEQRAVLVYQIESYRHWQKHFGRDDFTFGQFGENFTVDGLADDAVCIGDRYRIGAAEFEVTQPRVTCFRVGMRLGQPAMPSLLVAHRRPGFYLRVITEGEVAAGDAIVKVASGPGELTIADVDALLYLPGRDVDMLRAAMDIPALSPGWRQSFRELLDAAERGDSAAAPPVGIEPGSWSGFRALRVARVVAETPSVASIYLAADDGTDLPDARPGQYLTLRLTGAGRPAPVRSYSLSSGRGTGGYRISVKREPHGVVSGFLHGRIAAGTLVEAAAPRGEFLLEPGTEPVLLVSAGIGVTPVLAMLHGLVAERSERDVWWIHVARDRNEHAFADEAHRLLTQLRSSHERIFYTRADGIRPGSAIGDPSTRSIGRPDAAALAGLQLPTDASAYICGPESFMAGMSAALVSLGVPAERIHSELFGARSAINPGVLDPVRITPHQPSGEPGTGPLITFARSGLAVRWAARQRTVLELAEACDVPTRWSCRTGVCHTCVTTVLSGDVDYAVTPLEPPAEETALLCCVQPATDLVLDL